MRAAALGMMFLCLFGCSGRVASIEKERVALERQRLDLEKQRLELQQLKTAVPAFRTVTNTIGMELIKIPAGNFAMGEGGYAVAVTLTKSFWLGKTEVTQGQWQQVMGTEPWKGDDSVRADKDCPATYVSWDDTTAFCQNLTEIERKAGKLKADEEYRLATEAEWEYACRAGTTTAYSFGDDEKQLGNFGWFAGNTAGEQYAHAVGMKKPNPWGLHDMHGNVWEWCSDWYDGKISGGTDPVGPGGGSSRGGRGGCWRIIPDLCRSASRHDLDPASRSYFEPSRVGFRLARSQSETVAERRQQGAQAEPAPQVAAAERPVQLEVKSNTIGMELIKIPAGNFAMGEGGYAVAVTLTKPFWLGKTEVTQGQWKQVMGTEPWEGQQFVQIDEDNAASYASWKEATAFCQRLTDTDHKNGKLPAGESYRLPTEAEWEYACRAGTTTSFSFGDDETQLGDYAWFNGNAMNAGEKYAHAVGTKKPNPWGLHDMHGNVWEWCSDSYGNALPGGADPVGPGKGWYRVLRGGSWRRDPDNCRSAYRSPNVAWNRYFALGFRVARSQSVQ